MSERATRSDPASDTASRVRTCERVEVHAPRRQESPTSRNAELITGAPFSHLASARVRPTADPLVHHVTQSWARYEHRTPPYQFPLGSTSPRASPRRSNRRRPHAPRLSSLVVRRVDLRLGAPPGVFETLLAAVMAYSQVGSPYGGGTPLGGAHGGGLGTPLTGGHFGGGVNASPYGGGLDGPPPGSATQQPYAPLLFSSPGAAHGGAGAYGGSPRPPTRARAPPATSPAAPSDPSSPRAAARADSSAEASTAAPPARTPPRGERGSSAVAWRPTRPVGR